MPDASVGPPARIAAERIAEARDALAKIQPDDEHVKRIRYEHGGGRMYRQVDAALDPMIATRALTPERSLIIDVYEEGDREFYFNAAAFVRDLLLALDAATASQEQSYTDGYAAGLDESSGDPRVERLEAGFKAIQDATGGEWSHEDRIVMDALQAARDYAVRLVRREQHIQQLISEKTAAEAARAAAEAEAARLRAQMTNVADRMRTFAYSSFHWMDACPSRQNMQQWVTELDAALHPPAAAPLASTVAAIPGPVHPLRPHAEGVVGLRVREEPSAFLYGEIAAIARVLAGCERRLRAAIGEQL